MDQNNNPFSNQNFNNFMFNPQNPNNYYPNFPPNFPPNFLPNYPPTIGSSMQYNQQSSQTPPNMPYYMPMGFQNIQGSEPAEIPEFSTQPTHGSMSSANEGTLRNDSTVTKKNAEKKKRNPNWETPQNIVLLSGWLKYGTDSILGRNQKGEAFWGSIADYCNEYCTFVSPQDKTKCKNHFNYISKILVKWRGSYDSATRMKESGWSEDDVLARAHQIHIANGNGSFTLMEEWLKVRDQPKFMSLIGAHTGSDSSGSKRRRESDAGESDSIGSITRPMGRDAAKARGRGKSSKNGKGPALSMVDEEWDEFKLLKEQEFEKLEKIAQSQQAVAKAQDEATKAKKMKMYMKLSEKEHLNAHNMELLQLLHGQLFGNSEDN